MTSHIWNLIHPTNGLQYKCEQEDLLVTVSTMDPVTPGVWRDETFFFTVEEEAVGIAQQWVREKQEEGYRLEDATD